MGPYLRKYVKVGPLRFNLSRSGVGVSGGIRGLRLGAGPRGNYVHMGRHGLYYRAALPLGGGSAEPAPRPEPAPVEDLPATPVGPAHNTLEEIDSADVSRIVNSSSEELLEEINRKRKLGRRWPVAAVALAAALIAAALLLPAWAVAVLAVIGVVLIAWLYQRDVLRKSVVLLYDLDEEMEKAFGLLHDCALHVAACAGKWHVEASGAVRDRKYHAGASEIVRRKSTTITKAAPPMLQTNVETIAIGVGTQTLHLFPDRLLIYAPNGAGAVNYADLELAVEQHRFIEDGGVPADAQVVDRTWRYVNKRGGPDRRFKDNPQLPICLYESLKFGSASGLNEVVEVSRNGVLEPFAQAIRTLGESVRQASDSATR
jgi:hypothetical protein